MVNVSNEVLKLRNGTRVAIATPATVDSERLNVCLIAEEYHSRELVLTTWF